MKSKVKIFSVIFCAAAVLVCVIFYSSYVSRLYYEVCRPYDPRIESCEAVILEEVPDGYLIPDYVMDDLDHMKVAEITYDLTGTVNDTLGFGWYLCYYYGETGERVYRLDKDEDYWGVRNYGNCNILPPGEHVIIKEYVLVEKDIKEISAQGSMLRIENMTINLR